MENHKCNTVTYFVHPYMLFFPGGGQIMTIGNMLRSFLTKLEWHSTLFPRIPVPIQQKIEKQMSAKFPVYSQAGSGNYQGGGYGGGGYQRGGVGGRPAGRTGAGDPRHIPDSEAYYGEAEKHAKSSGYGSQERDRYKKPGDSYKRSYDSRDDKYSSGRDDRHKTRYESPDRKKYKDDPRDSYRDRGSSKHDKYKEDRYDRNKDDRYSREDRYDRHSSRDDKYARDKYSRDDKYRSRHDDDRDKSPRHHRRH